MSEETRPTPPPAASETANAPERDPHPSYVLREEKPGLSMPESNQGFDTSRDEVHDTFAWMAATFCGTPIVLISFLDKQRQWIKASVGHPRGEQSLATCLHAEAMKNPSSGLVVNDTASDARFLNDPSVKGVPGIRFYAGMPLLSADNVPIGVLSVMDTKPRKLSPLEHQFLTRLSGVVMKRLEGEKLRRLLNNLVGQEHLFYEELLKISAKMKDGTLSLQGILENLLHCIDPNLGWISVRTIAGANGGATCSRHNNTRISEPEIIRIWEFIDHLGTPPGTAPGFRTITPEGSESRYSLVSVPVVIRSRQTAVIEMLYPEDMALDERIRSMLELLADHLAVIAERELLLADANHRASHDDLTGAAGRSLIISEIGRSIEACDPIRPDTALLFFDLDGFKEVNDAFGHETGDRLLREVTTRLMGVCRDDDMLGRLSGDEFVLLARGLDVEEGLPQLLERILRSLAAPYMLGDLEIRVHASMGCRVIDRVETSPAEILRLAEEAMYLVKNGERKGFCIADEHMIGESAKRRSLERTVKQALRNGGLTPVFQPIINIETGLVCGSETLMRLRCRDGSIMPASEFMTVIQGSRFLIQLDEHALSETVRHFRTDAGKELLFRKGFRFTVNASSATLFTKGHAENCLRQLAEASIPASAMILEITETTSLPTDDRVIRNLRLLREAGVSVALDDFGSGYSNLLQLVDFPVDIIKIDRAFIAGIAHGDLTKNSLLGAILAIGKNLGFEIYAEGVEEDVQATYLKSVGCLKAQGFYFARPMPFVEMTAWARQRDLGAKIAA